MHRLTVLTGIAVLIAATMCGPIARGGDAGRNVPIRVAVHVDTSVSHADRTIRVAGIPIERIPGETPQHMEDIARMAREQNLDVVILADRARAEVSYGLTRFSRLFKVTVSEGSIASYGSARYLRRVRDAEAAAGITIIPAAECVPHYRWHGIPCCGLTLCGLYEHMVIAGLDTPEALDGLPDTAGGYGYRFSWTVLLNLVFAGPLVVGIRQWRRRPRPRKRTGAVLIAVAVLALADGTPFLPRRCSAYDAPTVCPADVLGRYAASHGALAFWAHPSAKPGSLPARLRKATGIDVEVAPYRDVLHQTKEYDGFAMFNAGIAAGEPGAEWDRALGQYCAGRRPGPVWVISECDFDADSPPDGLTDAQTVIWARDKSRPAVLDALRRGRCYATLTVFHRRIAVERYELRDGAGVAVSGETLRTGAPVVRLTVRLRVRSPEKDAARLKVQAIVNGEPTLLALRPTPDGAALALSTELAVPPVKKMSYVRALVRDNGEPVLALNPIFVSRETGD